MHVDVELGHVLAGERALQRLVSSGGSFACLELDAGARCACAVLQLDCPRARQIVLLAPFLRLALLSRSPALLNATSLIVFVYHSRGLVVQRSHEPASGRNPLAIDQMSTARTR